MDTSNTLSDRAPGLSVPVTNGAPAKTDPKEDRRLQLRRFRENCRKFPAHRLAEYAGKWIAWNRDGTEIVASGERPNDLVAALAQRGLTLSDVICEQILDTDDIDG